MRKGRNDQTEEAIQKKRQAGFGQGTGSEYMPWLSVRNISSRGRSCRLYNPKIGREMTCFSKLEELYCCKLMWADEVIDIREQYPLLPREETQRIAEKLGIRHPRIPGADNDMVMTTDFLLTIEKEGKRFLSARYVKPKDELEKKRVREKLLIEKTYWEEKGIEFKVVTEEAVNRTESKNIAFLMSYYNIPGGTGEAEEERIRKLIWETIIEASSMKIYEYVSTIDEIYSLGNEKTWAILYHMMAHKEIPVKISGTEIMGTAKMEAVIEYNRLDKTCRGIK